MTLCQNQEKMHLRSFCKPFGKTSKFNCQFIKQGVDGLLSEVSQPDLPEGFLICYLNLLHMKNPSYQCVSIDSEYLHELI